MTMKFCQAAAWLRRACLVVFTGLCLATPGLVAADPVVTKTDVKRLIVAEAKRLDFPPALALAVAEVESDFQPYAVSSKGALGVMQIMPATGWGEFRVPQMSLLDPRQNVVTGIRFLKQLMATYHRVDIALSHYNGGSAVRGADGSLAVIPATRDYVDAVLQAAQRYASSPLLQAPVSRPGLVRNTRNLDDFESGRIAAYREWQPLGSRSTASLRRRAQVKSWESVYDH